MIVRELLPVDRDAWLRLRERLWPDMDERELRDEQDEISCEPQKNSVLVAEESGRLVGFAEVSLRDWADGCDSRPVGYLEAWYVEPDCRRLGIGRALIDVAEAWTLARGCTEIGSDALLDNLVSHQAHRALGFEEVHRTVAFKKRLAPRKDA